MTFHCLGCGRPLIVNETGEAMAISCVFCGAMAPILVDEETHAVAPPISLLKVLALGATPEMHLEYYLGYSDHESSLRRGLEARLRHCGMTSQQDCGEEKCRQEYTEKLMEWRRNTRIAEVGEP